ncbi:acyl-CoA dehydrogenase family protein [Nonomuraea rhizosphaerae]|uniref:acyl-CoA dehydrogenase family protein n=1 Tax=Nonomuraea rhizosphaerae TaxID=2665663 RepID=UPI001C5F0731|nr:acyl-CoA dehydrogenase family protein [Nonomuraea rhizosphaerae]
MDRLLFDDDHDLFRDAVAAFASRELLPHHERFAAERRIDRAAWRAAGEQGVLGLEVPEEFGGGAAGDYRFNAVACEELAKVSMAVASCFSIHFDVIAPYLVDLATAERRAEWLPRFCSGELITAIAMTEPGGGSDLAAIRTTARRDGSDWIIDGAKTFITNGHSADLVLVAASTDARRGAKGITLFAVEAGTPGFRRGRKLDKIGQPEADTAELSFTDVRVPAANVVGEVGRGFVHMMEHLPRERLGAAVSNIAHAAQILTETLGYARHRTAFGQPIGSFQHNKFLLAELVTRIEVAQAYVDHCVRLHVARALSAADAAKAKWWSAQVQNDVLDACVQLHGGYGYMSEYRVARAWTDARVTKIWAGSNEIMKELIGRDLGL